MYSSRGSDQVCRWSFGTAGFFLLWKPHRGEGDFGRYFWSFCELPVCVHSDIFIVHGGCMTMGKRKEVDI